MRKDPKSFIQELIAISNLFIDYVLYIPGEVPLKTYEGKQVVLELIEELK